ncbi:hypothetical protein [Acidovorax sp. sic0104]|uniref:hypothetical protein n=1 Tax=Acidovorax sp. sic0104 TaxID=2854784 RepID=UPI001C469647|nr:hypothetical protein [Acidovorax sp. sic0104]MBV7542216.1 hypothetical protein [Acidovorax sp. sic0104]
MDGAVIIQDLTGDWPVYPGHPLVLAVAIMRLYATFADANAPTVYGWSAALGDSRIPGAGDHVRAAVRTLELGARGADLGTMIEQATRYWEDGQAGGHTKNVPAGTAQAAKIECQFRAIAGRWFNGLAMAE